jgi:uncharacterized protein YndB with AHSA1/START domain
VVLGMAESTQPAKAQRTKSERRLEKSIELNASPDQVWNALIDPKQLANWFPLEARVTPGVGGRIFVSWGPTFEGEGEIIAWEPGKRIAWKEPFATIEFTLEARGGKTIVRLVQSAFLSGEDWENEWFASTDYGWGFMLLGLQWTLERHPGATRQVRWPRQESGLSREETYARLLRAGGIFEADASSFLHPGASYNAKTTTGQNLSGRVEFLKPLRGFCISIHELSDALLWVTIEGSPGKIDAQIWLSAFNVAEPELDTFQQTWSKRLHEILP